MALDPRLIQLAIDNAPAAFAAIRAAFASTNPDAGTPTDAEIAAAFTQACISSIAKDEAWLAAHPANPIDG